MTREGFGGHIAPNTTLTPRQQSILAILREAVEANERCPGDTAIARRVGISHYTVYSDMRCLAEAGLIIIGRDRQYRIVTVTGLGTTLAADAPIPRTIPKETDAEPHRVERTPCVRCGEVR